MPDEIVVVVETPPAAEIIAEAKAENSTAEIVSEVVEAIAEITSEQKQADEINALKLEVIELRNELRSTADNIAHTVADIHATLAVMSVEAEAEAEAEESEPEGVIVIEEPPEPVVQSVEEKPQRRRFMI